MTLATCPHHRILLVFTAVCAAAAGTWERAAAEPAIENGQFRLVPDEKQTGLPASLQWRGTELLDAARGLGWSFTSFEFRSKIFREENAHVWAGKNEPRFLTDVGPATTEVLRADGWTTARTTYASSFAAVERRIMLHDAEPRLRIECSFRFTRRVVVHDPDMFRMTMGFAQGFIVETIPDDRQSPPIPFSRRCRDAADAPAGARFDVSLLPAGPMLVQTTDKAVTLVATGGVSGDVPSPVPARPLVLAPDSRVTFHIDVQLFADATTATTAWQAALRDRPETQKPAALLRLGDALMADLQVAAAEAVYLESARLDGNFATPYGRLAGLRRDHPDVPGTITEMEAFVEGAYRQPYDFGYILSGRGITEDERLTEEQRRLAIFNLLIAMENCQFNADFYCWAARPFEKLGMHAQACAIYRQALWAADHMPRSEEQREKHRRLCRSKIAALEAQLVGHTVEALPELIPVRVPPTVHHKRNENHDSPASKPQGPPTVVPSGVEWQTGIEFARPADEPLLLNLAQPARVDGPRPAVLCIHGGGLVRGRRESFDALCLRLAAGGYVAATIDYRLVPKHRHPSAIHDAKAAVRWLRAHADRYAIAPDRIGATGQSAGGYLAQMLGVTAGVPRFEGTGGNPEWSSAVSCVVNFYGPSDLVSDWDTSIDGKDILPLWFGGPRDTHRAAYVEGSPLAWVTPAAAPTLCIHGTQDRLVVHDQSVRLVERLREAGVETSLLTIEGAGHGFKGDERTRADAAMMDFFDKHLRAADPAPTR